MSDDKRPKIENNAIVIPIPEGAKHLTVMTPNGIALFDKNEEPNVKESEGSSASDAAGSTNKVSLGWTRKYGDNFEAIFGSKDRNSAPN